MTKRFLLAILFALALLPASASAQTFRSFGEPLGLPFFYDDSLVFVRYGDTLPGSCSNRRVIFHLTTTDGANSPGLYRCNGTAYVSAGGGVSGSGTAGKLAKFTDTGEVGDSIVTESGSALIVNGNVRPTPAGTYGLGTALLPWSDLFVGSEAGLYTRFVTAATAARTATFPDATGTVVFNDNTATITGKTLRGPDGSAAAPTYSFSGTTNTGAYRDASGNYSISVSGTERFRVEPTYTYALGTTGLYVGSGVINFGTNTFLNAEAANTLALRNSTNAQTFRFYKTFTDASNHVRGFIDMTPAVPRIGLEKAGTGINTNLQIVNQTTGYLSFATDNTDRWFISSAGHLLGNIDNTYDIGASGATRPRNVYAGTSIQAGTFVNAVSGVWAGSGTGQAGFKGPSSGVMTLYNAAENDFSRLQFGCTTNTCPALKRASATLETKLADDSGYAPHVAARFCYSGTTVCDFAGAGSPEGSVTASVGSTYRRTDGGAGTTFYVKESGSATNTGWIAK